MLGWRWPPREFPSCYLRQAGLWIENLLSSFWITEFLEVHHLEEKVSYSWWINADLPATTHAICSLSFHLLNYYPTADTVFRRQLSTSRARSSNYAQMQAHAFLSPPLLSSSQLFPWCKNRQQQQELICKGKTSSPLPFELKTRAQTRNTLKLKLLHCTQCGGAEVVDHVEL